MQIVDAEVSVPRKYVGGINTRGGGGTPHMKGVGMLRGVNFGFWSHLGCSGQNTFILAVKVSFRVAREKI